MNVDTLTGMLRIALWELCFGGGSGAMWRDKIAELRYRIAHAGQTRSADEPKASN